MNNRIKEIVSMLQEDPNDPFLHYALALEYQKDHKQEEAKKIFDQLLDHFPDYLPAYYQAAHFYWSIGLYDQANITFEKGIQLAKNVNETKTYLELSNSYQQFLFEKE